MPTDSEPFRVALAKGLRYEAVLRHRSQLESASVDLELVEVPGSDDEAVEALSGFHGVVWPHGPYRLAPFHRLTDLIGVLAPTVGVDHVDLQAATEAGVVVGHLPTFATEQTADIVMFLILGSVRRVPQTLDKWREGKRSIGEWERKVVPIGDMRGSVLALLGFGRIARAVAARAQAFGTKCIAYAPTVSDWEVGSYGVDRVDLEVAFQKADIVSIHLPLSDATHHFVDESLLRLMKPTAVLVNASRGPVVDEQALVRALNEGRIAGAGLDVFESEPPGPNNPLVSLPNVIWTPHAGGSTNIAIERVGEGSVQQMAWMAQGYWPRHVANPGVVPKVDLRRRGYPSAESTNISASGSQPRNSK